MRRLIILAVLAVLALAGCSQSAPERHEERGVAVLNHACVTLEDKAERPTCEAEEREMDHVKHVEGEKHETEAVLKHRQAEENASIAEGGG